jgi:hypothetical protein
MSELRSKSDQHLRSLLECTDDLPVDLKIPLAAEGISRTKGSDRRLQIEHLGITATVEAPLEA